MDIQKSRQTNPVTPDVDVDIGTQIARARATLEKLQGASSDAAAEADRARITFEREPTPQSHTSSAVAAQRAKNAAADAERFERETLQPLVARARRAEIARAEAEVMAQQSETIATVEGAFDQLVSAIEAFDGAIASFESLHHARVLAASCGVGLSPAFSLRREIDRLAPRLDRFGGVEGHHHAGRNAASIVLQQAHQPEAHIQIRIARKCVGVPLPTRAQ